MTNGIVVKVGKLDSNPRKSLQQLVAQLTCCHAHDRDDIRMSFRVCERRMAADDIVESLHDDRTKREREVLQELGTVAQGRNIRSDQIFNAWLWQSQICNHGQGHDDDLSAGQS